MCDPTHGCDGACGGTQSPYWCGFCRCEDCDEIVTYESTDPELEWCDETICDDCARMRREKEEESDE